MRSAILAFALVLIGAPQAIAVGMVDGAKIIKVRIDKSGKGMIEFDRPLQSSPPACAIDYKTWMAFDTNTEGGKSIYSMALAAQATGSAILARGTGTCDIYSVAESWSWGYIIK